MGEVRWTEEAERWLHDIYAFIAADNADAALKTIQGIIATARSLSEFPERGYRYHDRLDRHIRIVLYGRYRIAYLLKDSRDIDVLGVFHGALDLERHL